MRQSRLIPPLSVAILVALLALIARAEPPALSLSDNHWLSMTDVAGDAPATIELTSPDALPIAWERGNRREGLVPLVLLPGVTDPIVVTLLKEQRSIVVADQAVPHVMIDPRAYARMSTWRPDSTPADRRKTLLLAAGFGAMLLLGTLLRRGRVIALVAVALAWSGGLSIAASRRPTLLTRDEADGSRWYLATEPQTVVVPIDSGAWVPVAESMEQLVRLSPRIVVEGSDARIELTLGANEKACVAPPDRGDRR